MSPTVLVPPASSPWQRIRSRSRTEPGPCHLQPSPSTLCTASVLSLAPAVFLVRSATRVSSLLGHSSGVDPIQELADLAAADLLNRNATLPLLPFRKRGVVLVPSPSRRSSGSQIVRDRRSERSRHRNVPRPGASSHAHPRLSGGVQCLMPPSITPDRRVDQPGLTSCPGHQIAISKPHCRLSSSRKVGHCVGLMSDVEVPSSAVNTDAGIDGGFVDTRANRRNAMGKAGNRIEGSTDGRGSQAFWRAAEAALAAAARAKGNRVARVSAPLQALGSGKPPPSRIRQCARPSRGKAGKVVGNRTQRRDHCRLSILV